MPANVVEQIKQIFPVSEWVEVQTVKGYFSRLAPQQIQSFCEYFDVEISGCANRKASYYEPLIQLANSCGCH